MKFYEIRIKIEVSDAETAASEQLMSTACDVACALAGEAGCESFEAMPYGVKAYAQQSLFDKALLEELLSNFPVTGCKATFEECPVEDTNWNSVWESEGFEPIIVGKECIIHDTRHECEHEGWALDITIDAQQAFGTGTHETTRLMLSMLLEHDIRGKAVLDCGCGTGILSIAAAKRGAREVVAYDIDEWSVANALHNAALNECDDIVVMHGDAHVLSHVNGLFDIVMANINRNVLLADMDQMKEVMGSGAHLLLSGFFRDDAMMIAEKAGQIGLRLVGTREENEWCAMDLTE